MHARDDYGSGMEWVERFQYGSGPGVGLMLAGPFTGLGIRAVAIVYRITSSGVHDGMTCTSLSMSEILEVELFHLLLIVSEVIKSRECM